MGIIIGIQLFLISLFLLFGWLIKTKQNYWLLSGFAGRPQEEQNQLIENGYPQKSGNLFIVTAIGMLLLLPLSFTSFLYTIEVQFGFMILCLMGGLIYLSKYEVPHKRKRSYIMTSVIAVVTIGFIVALSFIGYRDHQLLIKENTFEISGPYGDEWKLGEISKLELLTEMPETTLKINGFGLSTKSKGYFKVKGYGKSLLFITKEAPYIYMKIEDQHLFLNANSPEKTTEWFKQLQSER